MIVLERILASWRLKILEAGQVGKLLLPAMYVHAAELGAVVLQQNPKPCWPKETEKSFANGNCSARSTPIDTE